MSPRRWPCCAALAALVLAPRARAAAPVVVTLHVAAAPAEARETREVLADLLARIGIDIVGDEAAGPPPLVDVRIDLSPAPPAPFVALAASQPSTIICRRQLDPKASREVLIESAAEIAYTAVETRARALGVLRAEAESAPPPNGTRTPSPTVVAPAASEPEVAVHVTPAVAASRPTYGVDAAAFATLQVRDFGGGPASAEGAGGALTWGLRRSRLGPALTAAFTYVRPIETDASSANLSIFSVRLTPTVNALAFSRAALQVGPSLTVDVLRFGATPPFITGQQPAAAPAIGAASLVAVAAGAEARLSIRVAGGAYLFLAGTGDRQLTQTGLSPRGPGPGMQGGPGEPAPSSWRSSFLAGLAFTVAGRSATPD